MKCEVKENVGIIVVPGDVITEQVATTVRKNEQIRLGPGLRQDLDDVVVCKSGVLRHNSSNMFWVDVHQKRYIPAKGDNVLGIIVGKIGDAYKVDIGSSDYVMLNNLYFEGASKRNRPNLINGDVVFGKLITASRDMEPEMSCIDQGTGKANGMGQVPNNGFLFNVSLNLVRKLLSQNDIIMKEMGQHFGFETIIGMNGKIHITSFNQRHVIALMNMITSSECMTKEQIKKALSETEENFR